jgi:hypothetical protein
VNFDRLLRIVPAGLLAASLYGCGTRDDKPAADPQVAETLDTAPADDASAAAPAAAPADGGQKPLTVADIDRWDKGMAAELEAVHAAATRLDQAKTGNDTLTAMTDLQDMSTLEAGAQAAGVDRERYNLIRSTSRRRPATWRRPWAGSTLPRSRPTSGPRSGAGTRPSWTR